MALMILLGLVIAIPGGCETVFAMSNVMLKATPVNDKNIPNKPLNMPKPRNQKAALFWLK